VAQGSPPSREVASLATKTVLNAQEISTSAQAASQDTRSTPSQESVSRRLNAPTVRSSATDSASASVTTDSSSMRASASMEAVSLATPRTTMEDVPGKSRTPEQVDTSASQPSSSSMGSVSEHAGTGPTLTTLQDSAFPAQLTATPASVTLSASLVPQDTNPLEASAS